MTDALEIMITDANRQTSKQSSNDVKFLLAQSMVLGTMTIT